MDPEYVIKPYIHRIKVDSNNINNINIEKDKINLLVLCQGSIVLSLTVFKLRVHLWHQLENVTFFESAYSSVQSQAAICYE